MIGKVLISCLKLYYTILDSWRIMCKVLKIKFKTSQIKPIQSTFNHLCIRLNDTKIADTRDLSELIKYVQEVINLKYLTIISGSKGFEKEIKLSSNSIIYHNFEMVSRRVNDQMKVNLVDNDSENLFLLKLKETLDKSIDLPESEIFKDTVKQFSSK